MNRPTVMDKDRLSAFVDGELPPEEAAMVVMHLADHPQDQAFVDDLTASNDALARAFAAPLNEPVPEVLRNLILGADEGAKVLPFRRKAGLQSVVTMWGGLAAGAALAAGLAVFAFLPQTDLHSLSPGKLAAGGELERALETLPTGVRQDLPDGGGAVILASVTTLNGFCREIEVTYSTASTLQAALVCNEGQGWNIEVVISEDLADTAGTDGFGTASGVEAEGFAPFLDRIGAGSVLTPEEEAAAIAKDWLK